MFLAREGRWIRRDKLAAADKISGVEGDPRQASPELGKKFLDLKIDHAVAQIQARLRTK
jgi:creatinine amidohydrolase/Fe(II)-dependent formamide hydrolase-like protein